MHVTSILIGPVQGQSDSAHPVGGHPAPRCAETNSISILSAFAFFFDQCFPRFLDFQCVCTVFSNLIRICNITVCMCCLQYIAEGETRGATVCLHPHSMQPIKSSQFTVCVVVWVPWDQLICTQCVWRCTHWCLWKVCVCVCVCVCLLVWNMISSIFVSWC